MNPLRPQRAIRLVEVVTTPVTAWALMRGRLAHFREQGYDLTLVSSPGELLERAARRDGVAWRAVPMTRAPNPAEDLRSLMRLVGLFIELSPHIVHASTPKAGLLASLAAWLTRVPCRLFTLRGLRAEGLHGAGARALIALERISCACAQQAICVSRSLRNKALELSLAPAWKLCVIGSGSSNGVDAARFESSEELRRRSEELAKRLGLSRDAPTLGFVGRRVLDKGLVELYRAFHTVRDRWPDVQLLVVGTPETPDAEGVAAVEAEVGLRNIYFTGFLEDPAPAYPLMNMLLLPSYREGFPNVSLEAAAAGVPVIASDATGCVDAVRHGQTGQIVPVRQWEPLAQAIARYIETPKEARQHGEAGRQWVRREFRPEMIWQGLDQLYREGLKRARIRV